MLCFFFFGHDETPLKKKSQLLNPPEYSLAYAEWLRMAL